jgi:hypothetical protein
MLLGLAVANARDADADGRRQAALLGGAMGPTPIGVLAANRVAERSAEKRPQGDTAVGTPPPPPGGTTGTGTTGTGTTGTGTTGTGTTGTGTTAGGTQELPPDVSDALKEVGGAARAIARLAAKAFELLDIEVQRQRDRNQGDWASSEPTVGVPTKD